MSLTDLGELKVALRWSFILDTILEGRGAGNKMVLICLHLLQDKQLSRMQQYWQSSKLQVSNPVPLLYDQRPPRFLNFRTGRTSAILLIEASCPWKTQRQQVFLGVEYLSSTLSVRILKIIDYQYTSLSYWKQWLSLSYFLWYELPTRNVLFDTSIKILMRSFMVCRATYLITALPLPIISD